MINKVKLLLVSFILFFGLSLTVNANTVDFTKKGSIEITLKEGTDNFINNAEITLYYIAAAQEENSNLVFKLNDELADCSINLDNLEDANLVNDISMCSLENAVKHVSNTDVNGIASFNDIDLGLYYVKQTKKVEGYSNFDSFLVAIPKVEEDVWTYDIKAKPKAEIYKVIDIIIEKKWNSNSNILPSEVTIELYNDKELIDSVKLNKDNNWTYTFNDMRLSDKYHIKEVNIPKGYTPSYKENNYTFTVINTDTLAYTGQAFYPIIIFLSLGIILVLAGIKIIKTEE